MKKSLLFLSILLLAAALGAQPKAPATSSDVVSIEVFPSLDPIPSNEPFKVALRIRIQDGWHLNGREGLPDFFVPLDVALEKGSKFEVAGPLEYPPGIQKALGGAAKAFPVYEGEIRVIVPLRLSSVPKEPFAWARFRVELQACDDKVCLAPAQRMAEKNLKFLGTGVESKPVNGDLFAPPTAQAASGNIIAGFLKDKGILITFLLIFFGGLALNLTPCVYPMIPITVAYFGNQKSEKALTILARAAAYVVGISVTYTALGVTAALTGKILGSALQSPWVLIGISTVLVVLSLSMFGLYEIQAPSWLLNRIAGGQAGGVFGALGMGLVFGVVAAPCVDPFSIGLLTFVAAKADPLLGFLMFFTLSLGLGFPYLWLGFFSAELQKLPKSGMWMVWVKKIFGMVLLGMPLYFLHPLFPQGLTRWVVPAFMGISGILLGWVVAGKGVTDGFKKFQRGFGLALALCAAALFHFWPQAHELPFKPYDQASLAQARAQGLPVFIDFSADWCIPCKELDLQTFSDARVHGELKDWVLLKADLTQYGSEPVQKLRKEYAIAGVPTLIFIGKDGKESPGSRLVGFIPADKFLEHLKSLR